MTGLNTAQYTTKTWYAYLQQQDALRLKYITCLQWTATLLQTMGVFHLPAKILSGRGLHRLLASTPGSTPWVDFS